MNAKLAELFHRHGYGFITEKDLPEVVAADRLQLCLVRCGGGRFLAPAQDVAHFVEIIETDDRDYVRDISLSMDTPPKPKPEPVRKVSPGFSYDPDPNGPTGHGELCHSDADPGL